MARRFIVKDNDYKILDDKIIITGKDVKHIQVLRYNINDKIVINNWICRITKMTKQTIELNILEENKKCGEPSFILTLYMAVLKNDKLDLTVQKAVELGVKKIVPFFSNNVIVKLDEKSKLKRKEKLQIIANEACKQCGRTDSVVISDFDTLENISREIDETTIFAYEKETFSMKEIINKIYNKNENLKNMSIIVGPEGGFTDKEVGLLIKNENIYSVSLGSRILRAETAAMSLVSILMYIFDNKAMDKD